MLRMTLFCTALMLFSITYLIADDTKEQSERLAMIEDQIKQRGVKDPRVLEALKRVERHRFVPEDKQHLAYHDRPLPIGEGQTISQPYIVALMTELARLKGGEKVLEIGTGSGYQAAVLSEVVGDTGEVYSLEIIESLATSAKNHLKELNYNNVRVFHADGYQGWPKAAPFDAIVVTAAPKEVPAPLKEQLKIGGRLVIPVGSFHQTLKLYVKEESGIKEQEVIAVRFVPMTGKAMKGK